MRSPSRKGGRSINRGSGSSLLGRKIAETAAEYGIEIPSRPGAAGISRDTTGKEDTMLRAGEEVAMEDQQQRYERARAHVQTIKGL